MNPTLISITIAFVLMAGTLATCGVQRLGAAKKEIGSLQTTVEACLIAAKKREAARKGALERVAASMRADIALPEDVDQNELEKHL